MAETSNRSVAVLFTILAALLAAQLVRQRGPEPRPASAAANEFSAARAQTALRTILGGDTPHPIGSAAHAVVRDRLIAQFRALGYETSIESRFACNAHLSCAPVENILARLPGQQAADSLVVAAHYDSVPAGPGASDDGIGVATLVEVARAVRTEQLRNPIVFLVTDGEEVALLGAEAFVADANVAAGAAAVINVDNRGPSGPSFMFETSRRNRWLVPLIARALRRPAATSLFNSIYELMPNDTDATVFKRAGKTAVNFAAVGNVGWYHTPGDSLAHVSPPTLQHYGDNVLAMTRVLGAADLRQTSDANAVFFDVLMLKLFWWPQGWSLWIGILTFVLLIVAALLAIRDDETRARDITLGVVGFFASLAVAGVLGGIVTKVALVRGAATWIAHPQLLVAAMWLIGLGSAVAIASWLRTRAGFDGLFLGGAICWCLIAIAVDRFLSGGAYIFLVPAAAMAILAMLRAVTGVREDVIAIVCAILGALVLYPLGLTIYDALGTPVLGGVAAIVALLTTTFAPAVAGTSARRAIAIGSFVLAAIGALVTIALPTYSSEWPRRIPIAYIADSDAHTTEWQVSAVAGGMGAVAPFGSTRVTRYPWYQNPPSFFVAKAPDAGVVPPEVTVVGDARTGKRTVTVRVRSLRGAQRVALMFHTSQTIDSVRVNGATPPPRSDRFVSLLAPGWTRVVVRADSADVELVVRGTKPIDFVAVDYAFGLPASGAALVKARDAANAVTSDDGELTIAVARGQV